jgi:outer membrane protein assembly factor BamB
VIGPEYPGAIHPDPLSVKKVETCPLLRPASGRGLTRSAVLNDFLPIHDVTAGKDTHRRRRGTRRGIHKLCALVPAILALASLARGGDWPQFMGPNSDGTSAEKGLARSWPAEGPKVLWTSKLGSGYGGAAVRGGKVCLMDRVDQKQDVLRCLDLDTGREDWSFAWEAPGAIDHEGSRSTPAVSARFVYALGPFGQCQCVDRVSGKPVWRKDLVQDYGGQLPRWKVAASPLLYQDLLIIAPQSDRVGVVALDQVTGVERWRSAPVGPLAYGSPRIVSLGGVDQVVTISPNGAAAVSAADGKVLWQYAHACKIPIPNVTVLKDDRLFITGGYNAGSAVFQVTRSAGQWQAKELARVPDIGGHCHPGLVHEDHLYLVCNTNERNDGLVCFDFSGKTLWQTKRDPSFDKGGSVLTADGLIYAMDGRSGEVHIVEPSPAAFKSLAKAKVLEGREIWGPLALADGRLLVRDQSQMKCLDLRMN